MNENKEEGIFQVDKIISFKKCWTTQNYKLQSIQLKHFQICDIFLHQIILF